MKPLLTFQEDLDERVLYKDELFEWPSEDAFNDRNRFYKVIRFRRYSIITSHTQL